MADSENKIADKAMGCIVLGSSYSVFIIYFGI